MSVILFPSTGVYQEMAGAYESLRSVLPRTEAERNRFYKALRRLYFANVATFLCQYHDATPLSNEELTGIETFQTVEGHATQLSTTRAAYQFLQAWGSLKYNLVTNDGEEFRATDSFNYLTSIAEQCARAALECLVQR